jgi:hypothetical protein
MNPRLIATLSSIALLSGCATITRGTTEALVINSAPPGADVRLSSGEVCKTPCTLKKKRKENLVVFIEKPGFEKVEVNVISEVAGAGAAGMAGNVLVGGLIGVGVDAATGATKKLTPNPVSVTLAPLAAAAPTAVATTPASPAASFDAPAGTLDAQPETSTGVELAQQRH